MGGTADEQHDDVLSSHNGVRCWGGRPCTAHIQEQCTCPVALIYRHLYLLRRHAKVLSGSANQENT